MASIQKIIIFLLKVYQCWISPFFPASCRFEPTCSQYAIDSFHSFPLRKAFGLTLKRIGRCQPYHQGGYDPLP